MTLSEASTGLLRRRPLLASIKMVVRSRRPTINTRSASSSAPRPHFLVPQYFIPTVTVGSPSGTSRAIE